MKRLYLLTICSVVIAAMIFRAKQKDQSTVAAGDGLVVPKAWLLSNTTPRTPKKDIRPADQTFLTYPEWFLVFSPEEQANYFKHSTSTTFPFMSHTAQIWESYKIVNDQIKDNFPTNTGYHFMIWVIGTSASFEYTAKAWYETVVGRVTDTHNPVTAEDDFNAEFTQDYVDFIKERPWYEFDFKSEFKKLWTSVPLLGNNPMRKLERRYILTSELVVKYCYGKLIGLGTHQVYEEAIPTTSVVLNNDSLVYLPRYDRFAGAAIEMAKHGYTFKEIAGNNSAILVSVLTPTDRAVKAENAKMLFSQLITSEPAIKRMVFATPVAGLSTMLLNLNKKGVKVEHVFDY